LISLENCPDSHAKFDWWIAPEHQGASIPWGLSERLGPGTFAAFTKTENDSYLRFPSIVQASTWGTPFICD